MTVFLVGAGPGDPDLLTRRAWRVILRADVIVVDRLVDRRVLDDVPSGTEVIEVGKRPWGTGESWTQADINRVLIEQGRLGKCVVRLKGGDPFVFGRGGEELDALDAAGIDVQVVPGISSSFALPALAHVPVTHRGESSLVTVVSGHSVDPATWRTLGALEGTIVLMMAVKNRAAIARAVIEGGRSASTPVLIIERGATALERRVLTTLSSLGDIDVEAPSVIVIGVVAARARPDERTIVIDEFAYVDESEVVGVRN